MNPSSTRRLPPDVLKTILDYLEPYPDEPIPVDRRRFLSVESFDPPPDPTPDSVANIGRFRCACKDFADLGAPLLFRRVAIRFSQAGFARLDQLAQWRHVACHVRKFSYMVPYFYVEGADNVESLRQELLQAGFQDATLTALRSRAAEQRRIRTSLEDVRVLNRAISLFTSLQLIQLLRVTNLEDSQLLDHLRRNPEARQTLNLDWTPACAHASSTIGRALLDCVGVPWSRFSSPMLSPASVAFLRVTNSIKSLAERLTCLTLHFDDGENLDAKMQGLSPLFGEVFRGAKDMQAVHLGFPSHRPLTLPLESIFHHVTWDKLIAFGVQGWELTAEEIIGLAQRHKDKLRGLRLRDVLLKDDSMWKDVLYFIREEMCQLRWVSLRRIGYADYFHSDQFQQQMGFDIGDDPFHTELASSDEDEHSETDEESDRHSSSDEGSEHGNAAGGSESFSSYTQNDDSDDGSGSGSEDGSEREEYGPRTDTMDFPQLHSPSTPTSAPWCDCTGLNNLSLSDAEELQDDGWKVDNVKWRRWEKWVLKRCPEHGRR